MRNMEAEAGISGAAVRCEKWIEDLG